MNFQEKFNKLNVEMATASLDGAEARELEARAEKLMGFYQEKVDEALAATREPAARRFSGRTVARKQSRNGVGGLRSRAAAKLAEMKLKGKKLVMVKNAEDLKHLADDEVGVLMVGPAATEKGSRRNQRGYKAKKSGGWPKWVKKGPITFKIVKKKFG